MITPDELYQFKVLPFWLCNGSAGFERMIDSLLRGSKCSTCLGYLDNVIVFKPTFENHIPRLSVILDVFRLAGLQLNPSKGTFGRRQTTLLGPLVDTTGVQPDRDKVHLVREFSVRVPQRRSAVFWGSAHTSIILPSILRILFDPSQIPSKRTWLFPWARTRYIASHQ